MDESTLTRIGTDATAGLHAVSGYVESLDTEGNATLRSRYRERFGRWAPPLSTLSESVFEGVQMWFASAVLAGTDEPRAVARAMHGARFELPRGTVTLDGNGGRRPADARCGGGRNRSPRGHLLVTQVNVSRPVDRSLRRS